MTRNTPIQQYKGHAADGGRFEFCGIPVNDVKTDTLASVITDKFPKVWKRCYTKHYDAPGVYRSFKYVAVQFAMGLLGDAHSRSRGEGELISNVPVLFNILEEYDWPTYHVHASMFAAMRRTHPPQCRTWEDINMPYPGVIFMLPAGSMFMPPVKIVPDAARIPIVFIGVARIKRGRWKFRSEYGEPDDDKDRMCVFWSADSPEGPISHDCAFPVTQALEPDPDWINAATKRQEEDGFPCDDVVDGSHSAALAGVIANLLLLREARPEQVEEGGRTGKALRGGTKIHRPTFIGRKYVVRREVSVKGDGSHMRFSEIGWRAGHMKEQPCGPRLAERKTIWIEPYMAHVRGLVVEKEPETALAASK